MGQRHDGAASRLLPRHFFRIALLSGAAAIALLSGFAIAIAAEWRITPRIDAEVAYTDNVELAPRGLEESDVITTVSPGISVRGDGGRVHLNFDYNPQVLVYADDSDRNDFRHRLLGSGEIELLERILFLEADASVSQQFIDNRDAVGGSNLNASNNLRTVQTYGIGPVLRNQFGPYAQSEVRYRLDYVNPETASVADTTTNSLSALLSSGSYFSVFGWSLSYVDSRTERSGSATAFDGVDSDRQTARADVSYAVSTAFSVLAGAGYEDINDATLTRSADGLIWDVGFLYRPSRHASLRVTVGERYNDPNINVQASYMMGQRTYLTASYDQTIETSQSLLSGNLSRLSLSPTGELIDSATGAVFLPGDPALGLDSSAFRRDRFSLGVNSSYGRNKYGLSAYHEEREFELANQNETVFGGQFNWSRRLSPHTDIDVNLGYRHSKFDDATDRKDDFYDVNIGVTQQLSETLDARLRVGHTTRNSNQNQSDLRQNLVVLGIGKTF